MKLRNTFFFLPEWAELEGSGSGSGLGASFGNLGLKMGMEGFHFLFFFSGGAPLALAGGRGEVVAGSSSVVSLRGAEGDDIGRSSGSPEGGGLEGSWWN